MHPRIELAELRAQEEEQKRREQQLSPGKATKSPTTAAPFNTASPASGSPTKSALHQEDSEEEDKKPSLDVRLIEAEAEKPKALTRKIMIRDVPKGKGKEDGLSIPSTASLATAIRSGPGQRRKKHPTRTN